VLAKDRDHVADLLKSAPQDMCTACMNPALQARCEKGVCTGKIIQEGTSCDYNLLQPFVTDHCGSNRPAHRLRRGLAHPRLGPAHQLRRHRALIGIAVTSLRWRSGRSLDWLRPLPYLRDDLGAYFFLFLRMMRASTIFRPLPSS